jgi:hypothetical protein
MQLPCPYCNKEFRKERSQNCHIRDRHPEARNNVVDAKSGRRPGRKMARRTTTEATTTARTATTAMAPYPCRQCREDKQGEVRVFQSAKALAAHIQAKHCAIHPSIAQARTTGACPLQPTAVQGVCPLSKTVTVMALASTTTTSVTFVDGNYYWAGHCCNMISIRTLCPRGRLIVLLCSLVPSVPNCSVKTKPSYNRRVFASIDHHCWCSSSQQK